MKAVVVHQFGDPSQLKLEEVPTPEPGNGEVLVAINGAAINPSDVKNVSGKMHGTLLPLIPGRDFAGVVTRGPGHLVGREVWGTGGDISRTRNGSHAEFIVLPANAVTLKPAALSIEAAAAAGLSFVTAWEAIVTVAALTAGETAVIFGAKGGVGSAAVQVAKATGARVIGVVRSDDDFVLVREDGADEVLNSQSTRVADAVRNLTGGRGAEVVFDASGMLFGEAVETSASDARMPIVAAPGEARLTPGFESGQFKAKPGRPMPLTAVANAYTQAARGGGRIILQPSP